MTTDFLWHNVIIRPLYQVQKTLMAIPMSFECCMFLNHQKKILSIHVCYMYKHLYIKTYDKQAGNESMTELIQTLNILCPKNSYTIQVQ